MNKGKILFGLLMCLPVFLFLANDRFEIKQSSSTLYAAYTECETGDKYCDGNVRYYCNSNFTWSTTTCTYGCSSGYCNSAPCSNNTFKCTSNIRYKCVGGDWEYHADCPYGCNGTVCAAAPTSDTYCTSQYCSNCTTSASCGINPWCVWNSSTNSCRTRPSETTCNSQSGDLVYWESCGTLGGTCVVSSDAAGGSFYCCCVGTYVGGTCSSSLTCVDLGYSSSYSCVNGQCVYNTPPTPRPPTPTPTSCIPVNGSCGTSNGSCLSGSPSGVGTTQVTGTGLNNLWSCLGSCGGSTDTCSSFRCTNQPVVDGACHSNVTGTSAADLCIKGTPVYVSGDANHDYIDDSNEARYIWGCQGSRNTCAEGDGDDKLDCVSIMDQKPWYQVKDGSILAKGKVENYVPPTCNGTGNTCTPSTVINGGIYSRSTSSLSNSDQSQKTSSSNLSVKTFPYYDLKTDYFDNKGVGTTFSSDPNWSNVKTVSGVIFVDGDLQITDNLNTANFVMVVAKGTITIDPAVTRINGILVANRVVAAEADVETTSSVAKLIVNGMIHGVNGVEFSRNLLPANSNNTSPSVEVNYNPQLLFMIPNELSKVFNQWKIN